MSDTTETTAKVELRTFEATKHPSGTPERARLNEDYRTSEFLPTHRFLVGRQTFRTQEEADAYIARQR